MDFSRARKFNKTDLETPGDQFMHQTNIFFFLVPIDIHIFGGNASSSLLSSIYCLIRSLLAVGILIGFAYGGLTGDEAHSHHTQEILFSIFCGLNVAIR